MDEQKKNPLDVMSMSPEWAQKLHFAEVAFVFAIFGMIIGLGLMGTKMGAPLSAVSIFAGIIALYNKIQVAHDRLNKHPVAKKFVVDVVHGMIEDAKAVVSGKLEQSHDYHEVEDVYEVDLQITSATLGHGYEIRAWNQERLKFPYIMVVYGGFPEVISDGTDPNNNF